LAPVEVIRVRPVFFLYVGPSRPHTSIAQGSFRGGRSPVILSMRVNARQEGGDTFCLLIHQTGPVRDVCGLYFFRNIDFPIVWIYGR